MDFFAEIRNRKIIDNSITTYKDLNVPSASCQKFNLCGKFCQKKYGWCNFCYYPELHKVNLLLTGKKVFQRKFNTKRSQNSVLSYAPGGIVKQCVISSLQHTELNCN